MRIPFKLIEILDDPQEIAAVSTLLKKKRGVLDCSGVDWLGEEQLALLFADIPSEWGFAELDEIIDVQTLSPPLAEQLMRYVQERTGVAPAPLPAVAPSQGGAEAPPASPSASAQEQTGTLHPIRALNRVIEEYRDYLTAEFRAKDPQLKEALERELDRPLFLAQEPFFQAHRPFKDGRRWRDLPIDSRLAQVMERRARKPHAYLHQSDAIEHLLGPQVSALVVTTGTGSGKSEAFLLPVIQNAIEDAVQFKKAGLTAILIYPMNALANDQFERIQSYLREAGFSGTVTVGQYDRGTSQAQREEYRKNPPHLLLTNYMMLEYLLVRPADRDGIFANHRCRFLVLDEVHSYRGTLGSNIALLVRRLRTHLGQARQDWKPSVPEAERPRRYPALIPIGTSATIKNMAETSLPRDEVIRLRDEAVQDFFAKLSGAAPETIRVLGEELKEIQVPPEARYPDQPNILTSVDLSDMEAVRQALTSLSGLPGETGLEEAARRSQLLWDLNRWLIRAPMSVQGLTERLRAEAPARAGRAEALLRAEVEAGLLLGAALPDELSGALRLRAHRFIRGGWQFHRCINPGCGKLYPMGEEKCSCGHHTAPLYLCRNCGADYLRFVGNVEEGILRPSAVRSEGPEWLLYEHGRFTYTLGDEADDEGSAGEPAPLVPSKAVKKPPQMRGRPVLQGSFDITTLSFSPIESDYALRVMLAPARTRCLCCGGSAGSRSVVSPIAIGTSAAVKVMSEGMVEALASEHRGWAAHDGKERLLVFSDSRQDAAHQARFIIFASRYDRLRRRLVQLLSQHGDLSIQRAVELLGSLGIQELDNPYAPTNKDEWITEERRLRIYAWEEAPLLDELSLNAGYRATVVNLGLVQVVYQQLSDYIQSRGAALASQLGLSLTDLEYICRLLLDEIRMRGGLSRELLRYHPLNTHCPDHIRSADWERRVKEPQGYALDQDGEPASYVDASETVPGITHHNAWRKVGGGGKSPSLERILKHLLQRQGGSVPTAGDIVQLLAFLKRGSFLIPSELYGKQKQMRLLQLNAESVRLHLVSDLERLRCDVCSTPILGARLGLPCSRCHGKLVYWPAQEVAQNRTVRRIRSDEVVPLVAGEHTAQVPNETRRFLEEDFKAPSEQSKVNLLACSPTLEMGIDVGGLDAVVLRNIPPRPDNYAQRGGRAGRRTRVGLVIGYARSTPHDQYFYDKPTEMIAGEVPAPALALGNRDVLLRHLNAIAFGAAEPGLAGKMVEYISPQGEIYQEAVDGLIQAIQAQGEYTISMALEAFGPGILNQAGLREEDLRQAMAGLPRRIQYVIDRTARQVQELRKDLDAYAERLENQRAGTHAGELIARLLGIKTQGKQADDRSAGYPLRRFAEFGILPGYEFPTEPASLRLYRDEHEEDPVTVARQFGIAQFQPDAQVYARTKRWRVVGLDTASPWNPTSDTPGWRYRVCEACKVRFDADNPRCPRCLADFPGPAIPAAEYAGFLARRDEGPILDEEDRHMVRSSVQIYPQWDGDVVGRWTAGTGWGLRLNQTEKVHWLNEGPPTTEEDRAAGLPSLHIGAKGFLLCGVCGRMLTVPKALPTGSTGKKKASKGDGLDDAYGHLKSCPKAASHPQPIALVTTSSCEILRLLLPVPEALQRADIQSWGLSLGYALRAGMRHLYMLDGSEIEFELEGPWKADFAGTKHGLVALSFIDPSIGGSGYLRRIADDFHLVAERAIEHLEHPICETACYRCLKSYQNQRYHDQLRWPLAMPALEAIAHAPTESRLLQTGDINDPRPWLDAYAAGVGSPLELKFLKLFEANGFHPQKQVPISIDGGRPITVADFAFSEERIAIYIDGAAFHIGANMRRDRFIRERLRNANPAWKVVELRASDLGKGITLINQLKGE